VSKKRFLIGEEMTEIFHDAEPTEPKLNRIVIIDALDELGIDVNLADWLEHDDNQILGDLASYSAILGIGLEDLFEACRIEIENVGGESEI
jgi:hypothetical protein